MRLLSKTLLSVLSGTAWVLDGVQAGAPVPRGQDVKGADKDGKYWIYGEGIAASFIPYGASISNLLIKDKNGFVRDVVMGFDNASYYSIDKVHPHLGGVPGRYANRIKNSTFELDGQTYHVTPNENPTAANPQGVDTLHGGPDGWDWRNFTVVAHTNRSITFSIVDPDGKEGFPGEVVSYITYTMGNMTWDGKMVAIATTKKTPIMLSSHTYWNLDGFSNNETNLILNHTFYLPYSGQRVAVDNILIPTGEIVANPKGSVNDFWSAPKQIGKSWNDPEIHGNCGFNCTGYDTCFLVNRQKPYDWRAPDGYVASLWSDWSGIRLKTTQGHPTGSSSSKTKFPRTVPQYGCVVLEVEDWIDGINYPEWGRLGRQVIEPGGDPYVLQFRYKFTVG
ncbi:uncharacterized protein THITE_2123895 [Thermothielavioides terrestris NRRL 8126]|uniref:Aldose 1-epimerase n=1 Tax=Thermothielavioides terrestris (strain ATCC 38088 / NRRL 8126) TaxID=578455 RepID=G2RI20_THETT|nr:uncharacterized protein THITE_2123895 [Thermothielavioides terrestris NRRL 8126]AEO71482.1 hypothetical protein THITE_2123895 [Thermothielavioides terrestris NRRL 8126]